MELNDIDHLIAEATPTGPVAELTQFLHTIRERVPDPAVCQMIESVLTEMARQIAEKDRQLQERIPAAGNGKAETALRALCEYVSSHALR